ncbi:MAG: biotin--[acetyl-CoA-carboxylase] ligase [Pseudomonadota bacterium]
MDECESTNTECLNAAYDSDPGNLWISALSQTAGRGSRGRSWTSSTGNLHASLLLLDPCEKQHLAELSFIAALAVRNTLAEVLADAGDKTIGLKWPNDVLVNHKKISGVLLESTSKTDSMCIAMGIGINCSQHPENTLFPATSLAVQGLSITSQELFLKLAGHAADVLCQWNRGTGFTRIRDNWLEHAEGLKRQIKINLPNRGPINGIFETIDERGYLLLRTANNETMRISAGDVFFD